MVPDIDTLLNAVLRFNQDRRLLRVKSPLDGEVLMVQQLDAREEVSRPFDLKVTLLSPYAHLELKSIIGQPMRVTMTTHVDTERHFHGYVREFARVGADGGFVRYEARVAPWFWFLQHRTNCRIFQDLNVVAIARKVFAEYGALAQARFDVQEARYPVMPYCVQYNESDLAFVSRLLEDAGIHYRFEHAEDGHTLVASDDSTQCPPQPDDACIRFHGDQGTLAEDVMDDWTARRSVSATARALKTFDFKQPANPLAASTAAAIPRGLLPPLEAFEYDGAAAFVDPAFGDQRASLRMEELAWRTKLYEGKGTSRLMQAGFHFQLDEHFEHEGEEAEDRQFFAVSVVHQARNNFVRDYAEAEPAVYRGEVTCVRRKVPFRPVRSPAPRMPGPQTATVVGPPGEELYADKFGRVKVQFHWDREGQSNEMSSCYVRVASPWAGEGMGGVSIPRVGQEVVVDFLDGNPDRPIIVGRVYNGNNMPPFGMEVSGIRSKTVKGGGYNELAMHDAPGSELLNLQAERNMDTLVKNDQNNTIKANKATQVDLDHTETVGMNQTMSVGVNQVLTVGANQDFTIKANRTATVDGTDTRTVKGTSTTSVTGDVSQTYNAKQTRSVASDYTETVGGNWGSRLSGHYTGAISGNWADTIAGTAAWTVGGAVTELLKAGRTVQVTGSDVRQVAGPVDDSNQGARTVVVDGTLTQASSGASALHADADMAVTSGSKIDLGVGGSGITIEGGSIVITSNGATIKVDAGGVTINGAKINLNS
jgi:type VI secretion system secreted protein VgrG